MLTRQNLDDVATIALASAENAGATLARWLNRRIRVDISKVEVVRLDLIPQGEDEGGHATVTLASRVKGELPGNAAVQLSYADAAALVACLGGTLPPEERAGDLGAMERSMLQETANILFSALMNGFAQRLGLRAVPHAPTVLVDVGTAAWATLLLESAEEADEAVVVTACLASIGDGPRVRLVFLPAPGALFAAITLGAGHAQR